MKLNISSRVNVYSDLSITSSPRLNDFLYERDLNDLDISKTKSQVFDIPPNSSSSIISTVRNVLNTGTWSIKTDSSYPYGLSKLTSNFISGLRVERLNNTLLESQSFTTSRVNQNIVHLTFVGDIASNLVAGDGIYIGEKTDIPSDFWKTYTIVAIKNNKEVDIISSSLPDSTYTILEDNAVFAFSREGVQSGDFVYINGGASYPNQGVFQIDQVTSRFVFLISAQSITESNITIPVLNFVEYYFKFLYVETSQEILISLDSQSFTVKPLIIDESSVGQFFGTLNFCNIIITNMSSKDSRVKIFAAS